MFADKCLTEYEGKSGRFSTVNRPCEFNIYYSEAIELTFDNIQVSTNHTINILQGFKRGHSFASLGNISSDHSGKIVNLRNIIHSSYDIITFRTSSANSSFQLFFKPYESSKFGSRFEILNAFSF